MLIIKLKENDELKQKNSELDNGLNRLTIEIERLNLVLKTKLEDLE